MPYLVPNFFFFGKLSPIRLSCILIESYNVANVGQFYSECLVIVSQQKCKKYYCTDTTLPSISSLSADVSIHRLCSTGVC